MGESVSKKYAPPPVPSPLAKACEPFLSPALSTFSAHQLWAESYDATLNPLLHLEMRRVMELLPELDGWRVADLGCGTGRWLTVLRDRAVGGSVVGIDYSPAMLAKAAPKQNLVPLLVRGDLNCIPVRSLSIDFILCSFVLGYIERLNLFAAEATRILKPGARIFCTDVHPLALQAGWKRSFRHAARSIHVPSVIHPLESVIAAFSDFCRLVCRRELYFGGPEQLIFDQAGKSSLFEANCQYPAVIMFEWQKLK
jgi:malonyl-CoA O-methyltransferase